MNTKGVRRRGLAIGRGPGIGLAAALVLSAVASEPVVRPGWDWTLPGNVKPAEYSGFVTWGGKRFDPSITVRGVLLKWADLNPAPGRYRWDLLTGAIESNAAAGMRSGLHLKGVERPVVPDWVVERFRPPVIDVIPLQTNQPWRLQIVAPWHPDVDRAFQEFLAAFARTGIARRPEVVYAYIHGISPSRGEELFLRREDVGQLEGVAGLTPEVFGDWLRRRLDGMLVAFAGVEGKLAWMSGGPVGPTEAYRAATSGLWHRAIGAGAGIRGGGIDFQHGLFQSEAWGSRVDPGGYCVVDDANPTIAGRRFRGDENEEYGSYWEWRFGPVAGHEYRHRICSLRGLQMRQNFQMVSPETLRVNPDLNRYVLLTQGRFREDSPDAWAYLRECRIRDGKVAGGRAVRNIERWLVQRDVDGSRTVPAARVDRVPLSMDPPDVHHDFDARRTDRSAGQDGICFRIDRSFWPGTAPAEIKVTFRDDAPSRWRLVTTGLAGSAVRSGVVVCSGDGELKTATFHVDGLNPAGALPGGMDFRLHAEGPGDLTVSMVRVLRAGD